MKITDKRMVEMLRSGRFKAIIKDVAGRRMLLGFERTSSRSRKYREKFMCSPTDLDQLVRKHQRENQPATTTATEDGGNPAV